MSNVEDKYLCKHCKQGYANCNCDKNGNPIKMITDTERLDFMVKSGAIIHRDKDVYWLEVKGNHQSGSHATARDAIDLEIKEGDAY